MLFIIKQRMKYDVKKSNMVLKKGNVMLNKGGSGLGCTSIKCTPELAKPSLLCPLHWTQQACYQLYRSPSQVTQQP